jgi:hypothetical protein
MNLKAALTGVLPAAIIVSAVMTALLTVVLLWLFRRAVVAASRQSEVAAAPLKPARTSTGVESGEPPSLSFIDSTGRLNRASAEDAEYGRAMQSLDQASLVYALAGLAYALVFTTAWMIALGDGFILTRFLWLFSCYCWPTVLAVSFINPAIRMRIGLAYCAFVLFVAGIVMLRNPHLTAGELPYFWLSVNGLGTILLAAFLNRRVRAVGPLMLAFMTAAVTGAVIILDFVGSSDGLMRGIVKVGETLGLGATAIFVLLHIIGLGLFGLLGWQLLRWLGQRYQKKRMSEQSNTLDAMWLFLGVVQSYTFVFEGLGWISTGIISFATYKLLTWAGFAHFVWRRPMSDAGRTLLLLRVFALGQRSQRLFDLLSKIWLCSGNIRLMSGPDLLTTTVQPRELLNFVAGRLCRRFVQGKEDLEQRLSEMDSRPDPDGRYRMHEFFCRADTWQITLERLARESDAVFMDLRSFSRSNQGCLLELQLLINHIRFDRIVLSIDDSTDRAFLEGTIKALYQRVEPSSPNAEKKDGSLCCFVVRGKGHHEIESLSALLFKTSWPSEPIRAA